MPCRTERLPQLISSDSDVPLALALSVYIKCSVSLAYVFSTNITYRYEDICSYVQQELRFLFRDELSLHWFGMDSRFSVGTWLSR